SSIGFARSPELAWRSCCSPRLRALHTFIRFPPHTRPYPQPRSLSMTDFAGFAWSASTARLLSQLLHIRRSRRAPCRRCSKRRAERRVRSIVHISSAAHLRPSAKRFSVSDSKLTGSTRTGIDRFCRAPRLRDAVQGGIYKAVYTRTCHDCSVAARLSEIDSDCTQKR